MKLLLLDKDGTLIESTHGTFVNRPWHQRLLPGVRETVDRYVVDGWTPIVISNQGGVEKGHKSLESACFEMQFLMELLPAIKTCYFCPDFAGEKCWRVWNDCSEEHRILYTSQGFDAVGWKFRKPDDGMLKLTIHHADLEMTDILYVGDRAEDVKASQAARIPFMIAEEWCKETIGT